MKNKLVTIAEQLDLILPKVTAEVIQYLWDQPEIHSITWPQAFLLKQIDLQGACTASQIGELMGITSGPVTSMTQRLVKRDVVKRTQDTEDRRVVWFSLTEKGKEVVDEIAEIQKKKWIALLEAIGLDNAERLVELARDFEQKVPSLLQATQESQVKNQPT